MGLLCWDELVQYGALDLLQREYSAFLLPPSETEADYNVSLRIELESLPADQEARAEIVKALSLLKRNALAAPFERAFAIQKQLEANPPGADEVEKKQELMSLHYRQVISSRSHLPEQSI